MSPVRKLKRYRTTRYRVHRTPVEIKRERRWISSFPPPPGRRYLVCFYSVTILLEYYVIDDIPTPVGSRQRYYHVSISFFDSNPFSFLTRYSPRLRRGRVPSYICRLRNHDTNRALRRFDFFGSKTMFPVTPENGQIYFGQHTESVVFDTTVGSTMFTINRFKNGQHLERTRNSYSVLTSMCYFWSASQIKTPRLPKTNTVDLAYTTENRPERYPSLFRLNTVKKKLGRKTNVLPKGSFQYRNKKIGIHFRTKFKHKLL